MGLEESRSGWPRDILIGLAVYAVTTLPVYMGLTVATTPGVLVHTNNATPSLLQACCFYDGGHYHSIVEHGYWFAPDRPSNMAFFPVYPLASEGVRRLTHCPAPTALVATANASLALALIVFSAYLRVRYPDEPLVTRMTILTLFALWPASFFFRMAYSESLFLLTIGLLLLGFARRWPLLLLALIAGASTGVRAVGLSGMLALLVFILTDPTRGTIARRIATAAALAPVACWGLLAFMLYQYDRFGTPVAFAIAHEHWSFYRPGPDDLPSKFLRLALAEPIWNAYIPGSSRHWELYDRTGVPILGVMFWNPIFFAVLAGAVAFGWVRGWLTRPEVVLGAMILFIPYVTRADEMSMGSHARFSAVAFPAFVVLGLGLSRLPRYVSWAVFIVLAPMLCLWTMLFAARWPLC